jgi:DNA mismatch repair protein MutS
MSQEEVLPLRKQYLDIKSEYPDCILLFRLGDFYETFDNDAETAARELDLTLTSRPVSKNTRVPMAGVPYHAVENYIARLIEKGYHVAVCDQVGEIGVGKGPVERQVTRVITPGTIIEPELLPEKQSSYLMAVLPVGSVESGQWDKAGLAYVDISTGEFAATQLEGTNTAVLVLEELARLAPREVIMPQSWVERGVSLPAGVHLSPLADWHFEYGMAEQLLTTHFKVRTLDGYGLKDMPSSICAAGAVLHYVRDTQRNSLAQLMTIRAYSTANFMVLDQFTRRNLELTETLRSRKTQGSLLGVLDRTITAMGARLLRTWISQPLLELNRLNARLDAVDVLTKDATLREELIDALRQISDIERLSNRLLIDKAGPRDLIALRESLGVVPHIQNLIGAMPIFKSLKLDACEEVNECIHQAITDDPPATLNHIGIIRPGYAQELDEVLAATRDAREWIANLEPQERKRTGINTLKVGFNKVFGYYIEVSRAQQNNVPSDYIRKQTLVNGERFITPELKEYETLVLNAEEQILEVERRLFDELCRTIQTFAPRLLQTARAIAHLDAFLSLAEVAVREGYTRPTLTENDLLVIRAGRHPVVEKLLEGGARYVPNDVHFDTMSRVHIITGPNMAGKSTFIRQVAVITLMAQIGSFVPADEATIGMVDRIFARIGAQDEIHAGQSTFMVEMVETARILSGSTPRSLLILDEVGRGTSTYDGLAIARAVIEYIHNNPRLNCRTLFATHYHELTELPNILPRTRNFNVAVTEEGEDVVFLHRVIPGGADRSYGVHVAQLAGMPRPVVDRANELLNQLEQQGSNFQLPTKKKAPTPQLSFIDDTPNPALEVLRKIEVDSLSPLEALTKLYELKRMAGEK